ncbi:MAG: nitroreductase family protein [Deltaproteobacteria bacterium]|nr:nitroreductase family protein [Deltaproteobacteria bacterium]
MGTKQNSNDSTWEAHKSMFRPRGVHMGMMQCDAELCTQCGLCIENCPFRAWEADESNIPRLRPGYACFSCYNCMVACPTGAISIVTPYQVDKGSFYETLGGPLEPKEPLDPLDAEGQPDAWTTVEKTIFERRSVRNFKSKPVPEHLVRRVLEAGRFAPSSGNCQPWKFIVITDRELIQQINTVCLPVFQMLYTTYTDDDAVKNLIPLYLQDPRPGSFDPRIVLGGIGSIAKQEAPMVPDAPVLILVVCDKRSIGGPDIQAGICGQNMNLAAHSLGLGFCWIGFTRVIDKIPELKQQLGIEEPWAIATSAVIGYPKFKQKGMVPREKRPVTWFRPGQAAPVVEP